MVSLPTQPEVLAIEEAHRAAQARLGIAGAYLAIRDWSGVSVTATTAGTDAWLTRNLQMIRAIQRKSTRLAKAYYQLARAIETGYTLGLPEASPDPKAITMGGLRKQYLDLLLEVADLDKPDAADITPSADPDERRFEQELQASAGKVAGPDEGHQVTLSDTDLDSYIQEWLGAADAATDDTPIKVDDFQWPDQELTLDEIRSSVEDELNAAIEERANKIARIQRDEEISAKQAFTKAQALHDSAGSVSAGLVDQAGIDAGRETINYAHTRDRRVMQVARGTGPNPCAFCALLAARGFVYTNKLSASMTNQPGTRINNSAYKQSDNSAFKKFHPNCHCFPVVRWADIPDPTSPGRSDEFAALYKEVVQDAKVEDRGTNNDALNQFRRELNRRRPPSRRKKRY